MALDPNSTERPRKMRPGSKIAAVVSRFHDDLTGAMLRSATAELVASGVEEEDIRVAWVPGSFELPLVCRRMAAMADVEAVLAIGLILKGETRHDEVVADAAVQGTLQAMMITDTPVLFGVLTCDTLQQAKDRALSVNEGGKEDKGREIARAAIDVLCTLDDLSQKAPSMGFRL